MSSHDQRPDPDLERRLRALLRDSVSGVEPEDRLGELRARVSAPRSRRPAVAAVAGSVLAAAAVIVAVAVVGPLLGDERRDPATGPDASSSTDGSGEDSTEGSTDAGEPTGMPLATRTLAGYYLGDTPAGVRLFREFRSVQTADDGPGESLALLTSEPADPDYRTLWPDGAFAGAEIGEDRITVELADTSLVERPDFMTEETAAASVQQVVFTLQAYAQQRLPVEFVTAEGPAERVLGTTYDEPVAATSQLDVLSLVNLSDPTEATVITGRVRVAGVARSFEGNVPWELRASDSGEIVDSGEFTARGWLEERLYPFSQVLDLTDVAPGTYTLTVTTDPTGEGGAAEVFQDDRTLVVE